LCIAKLGFKLMILNNAQHATNKREINNDEENRFF